MSTNPRREHGMTLMELLVAIVVISVGLAGVLVAFNQAVRHSADPMIRKQMLAIAEEMMEEITLKPVAAAANVAPGGCARSTYNDVSDYDGYASTGICDIDGAAIGSLTTYDVTVAVAANNLPNGVPALRVTVTVTHGAEVLTLVGYRTQWA